MIPIIKHKIICNLIFSFCVNLYNKNDSYSKTTHETISGCPNSPFARRITSILDKSFSYKNDMAIY